jgi:hypothetical protein
MMNFVRRAMSATLGVLVLTGVAACGDSGPGTAPSGGKPSDKYLPSTDLTAPTSASPTLAAGRTYTLPPSLCKASDLTALTELYPKVDEKPLADSSGICATSLRSNAAWIGLTVDSNMAPNGMGQAYLDTGRRLNKEPATDLPGVGTAAYWTVRGNDTKLVTFDGNLILEISVSSGTKNHPLPADIAQRLGRVANGTFARLAK